MTPFLDKLLFYSVITSYRVQWELNKTTKTRTVSVRGKLSWRKKLPDILGVESLLFVLDFYFVSDVICAVLNPSLDVRFRFENEFFFGEVEYSILSCLREQSFAAKIL